MDKYSEVHPQLRSLAGRIPELKLNRFTVKIIRLVTRFFPKAGKSKQKLISNVKINRMGIDNKLRLRIYQPQEIKENTPGLLWIHGGGLVIGTPALNDHFLIQFVKQLGIVIVSVDYRLAPENPYPAALNDCYEGLLWMAENASALSIDKNRISVGGESAGGGLAAVLAQMALDKGEIYPKFQFLVYPMLDDRTAVKNEFVGKKYIGWDQKNNYFGWKSYLNLEPGSDMIPSYASASRREDLSGLPPAWIFCGDQDMFYDEDLNYAKRLNEYGVQCQFETIKGVYHGFDSIDFNNEFINDFRKRQIEVLRNNLF